MLQDSIYEKETGSPKTQFVMQRSGSLVNAKERRVLGMVLIRPTLIPKDNAEFLPVPWERLQPARGGQRIDITIESGSSVLFHVELLQGTVWVVCMSFDGPLTCGLPSYLKTSVQVPAVVFYLLPYTANGMKGNLHHIICIGTRCSPVPMDDSVS